MANRTRGTGCPDCAWTGRGRSLALAPAGASLDDLHQYIFAEFGANLDRAEFSPQQLRAGSSQRCRWRCSTCRFVWQSTVATRTSGRGCPACGNEGRRASRRRIAPGSPTAASVAPHLLTEFVRNLSTPGKTLGGLKPASLDRCEWRCAGCGRVWEATARNRVVAGSAARYAVIRSSRARRVPKDGRTFAEAGEPASEPGGRVRFLRQRTGTATDRSSAMLQQAVPVALPLWPRVDNVRGGACIRQRLPVLRPYADGTRTCDGGCRLLVGGPVSPSGRSVRSQRRSPRATSGDPEIRKPRSVPVAMRHLPLRVDRSDKEPHAKRHRLSHLPRNPCSDFLEPMNARWPDGLTLGLIRRGSRKIASGGPASLTWPATGG